MTRTTVEQSLDAVEEALSHFVASLERAGFSAGSDSYRKMANVVLAQWLWVEDEDQRDLEPRYLRVAELANSVAVMLTPYVVAMRRLSALRGIIEERWGVNPNSTAGRIISTLASSIQPMSVAELRDAAGMTSTTARQALQELVEEGMVTQVGDRRRRYALAGRA